MLWRGPAAMHTRGDTMIIVEEDRVLFTGDVVMSQRFLAAQNTSSITTWLSTLDELASLKPAKVVPSHGSIDDATMIARARAFLQTVQERVGELKRAGKSSDEAAAAVVADIAPKYPEWGNPRLRRERPWPVRMWSRMAPGSLLSCVLEQPAVRGVTFQGAGGLSSPNAGKPASIAASVRSQR
jgi:hypothetical protein